MRHPAGHRLISLALFLVSVCLHPMTLVHGQNQAPAPWYSIALGSKNGKERWRRVSTENGFVSDVDSQSLVIGKDRSITARFRMTFAKAERLTSSDAKYKTREDTVQFDPGEGRYRIVETRFIDGSERIVATTAASDWKPVRSGFGARMFEAAAQLHPFGAWNVLSYRYASGEPASADDPPDLRDLIRSYVLLRPNRFVAGNQTCNTPVLEARTITDEEYNRRIGSSLKTIGIPSDKVDVIVVKCDSKDSFPTNTILLPAPDGKIAMLWNGVFLELEKSQ